jgi:hypothetical protein
MPRFKVGDQVERIGSLVPLYKKNGAVTKVLPDDHDQDHFTQYEVNFRDRVVAIFYETQLRPADPAHV